MEPTLFDRSVQTLALMDRLREVPIGGIVEYDDLTAVIGERIQDNRHYLYSALKGLQSEGVAFGTVRTVGLRRLQSHEVPTIGDHALVGIRRTSKRARNRMRVIERMNDVSNATRIRINATSSLLGVIEHFTSSPIKKEAEKTAESSVVPPMKLIDALRSK